MLKLFPYQVQYRSEFKKLNVLWIEDYFCLEPDDHIVLSDPETYILKSGGYIFLARCHEEIVGTCALIKHTNGF